MAFILILVLLLHICHLLKTTTKHLGNRKEMITNVSSSSNLMYQNLLKTDFFLLDSRPQKQRIIIGARFLFKL